MTTFLKFDSEMHYELVSLSTAYARLLIANNIQRGDYVAAPLKKRTDLQEAETDFYSNFSGDFWTDNQTEIAETTLLTLFNMELNPENEEYYGHVDAAIKQVNEAFELNNLECHLVRRGLRVEVV